MRRFKAPSFIRRDDNVGSKAQEGDGNSLARNDAAVGSQGSKCGSRSAMIATPKPQLTDKENVKTQTQNVARHYAVLYTKRAPNKKRKNKQFADGVLVVKADSSCTLYNEEGKVTAKSKAKGCWDLADGADVTVGNWEIEVDRALDEATFRSGRCFQNTVTTSEQAPAAQQGPPHAAAFRPPQPNASHAPPQKKQWLHDPGAEGSLVLSQPTGNGTPVVVDPYICRHLRAHQREGVAFLFKCVMGMRSPSNFGAVLADEMGLGKTLQVIALIWTLLKQGPQGSPVARKCIVVTPCSLTNNWAAEIRKWLGDERLRAMVLQPTDSQQQVTDFKHGAVYKVLIASYEVLRRHATALAGACDLLVCDEGHRLKAAGGSKTLAALLALGCRRRVLLTGTPLQNNLEEFYALVSFACPDALGSLASFRAVFAAPIARGQDKDATAEEVQLGGERSAELSARAATFLLRRTAATIAKFLPPLHSYVVFCRPSSAQVELYTAILGSPLVRSLLGTAACPDPLPAIMLLRKLCNHQSLLPPEWLETVKLQDQTTRAPNSTVAAAGKLASLAVLMEEVLGSSTDKLVVACGSVRMLDLIKELCEERGWGVARIDGSTPAQTRQEVVDAFNRHGSARVCLLSTRAGGAGLNLVGANYLVLFDSDWNPAMDLQAMARIWRDGQPKPCFIYRLLTTGTIEEKIYQRQLSKGELASVMGGSAAQAPGGFSRDELRELFLLDAETRCSTADLLGQDRFSEVEATEISGPLECMVQSGLVSFVHSVPRPPDPISETPPAPPAVEDV